MCKWKESKIEKNSMQQQQHQMNDDVINEFVFVCFEAKTEEKKHLLCTKQTFLLLIHLKTKKKFWWKTVGAQPEWLGSLAKMLEMINYSLPNNNDECNWHFSYKMLNW